jgi:hypothetical protein
MRKILLAVAFIIYPFHATLALSSISKEPLWAARHIEGLPRELRNRVLALQNACGDSIAASHYFSTSIDVGSSSFAALHFENLRCRNAQVICSSRGCLHEIYIRTGQAYRRILSLYARDIRMTEADGKLEIQVSFDDGPAVLRWTGRNFVRTQAALPGAF